ncbi:MAG TPA: response regulator transcription factor [Bacteroidales bacterium]|nr:response regulator transcription factor [Bacteroidales bacterium]
MENKVAKILIIDDEPDILEFLSYNLKKKGFEVDTASSGAEGIRLALEKIPDLIVLDIMMPEMDGIETCQLLRAEPNLKDVLILFLTARGEDYSQLAGFEAGADDYVKKPVSLQVLLSRIQALLRRKIISEQTDNTAIIQINDLIIDNEKHKVFFHHREIFLTKKEFELLYFMASKPGKVFSRDEIYSKVWGNDLIVGERTIDVHIRKLREKLGNNLIKTYKGIGYCLG